MRLGLMLQTHVQAVALLSQTLGLTYQSQQRLS
jgi:hypothetical protein